MKDSDCVQFLQWALPRLGLCWSGFRKVRGQVCKNVDCRLRQLGLTQVRDYQAYCEANPAECGALNRLCVVTISRFYRDQRIFQALEQEVLPRLAAAAMARGERVVRAWSAGCACGEEAYTLALLWDLDLQPRHPDLDLRIVATDVDENVLARAAAACYRASSLKELPGDWLAPGFICEAEGYRVRTEHRDRVAFFRQDIRAVMPEGQFDAVLCRNLALTYFGAASRARVMERIGAKLVTGGALVVGTHESLPACAQTLEPWPDCPGIYRKRGPAPKNP